MGIRRTMLPKTLCQATPSRGTSSGRHWAINESSTQLRLLGPVNLVPATAVIRKALADRPPAQRVVKKTPHKAKLAPSCDTQPTSEDHYKSSFIFSEATKARTQTGIRYPTMPSLKPRSTALTKPLRPGTTSASLKPKDLAVSQTS